MKEFKPYWWIVSCVSLVIFIIGLIPFIWSTSLEKAFLFYGTFLFAVLLGITTFLIFWVAKPPKSKEEFTNSRIVDYVLRLAFILGIGAVSVAILLLAGLLFRL